ncbi:hypothetical protein HQ560_07310 [bacterium]|nr:hypothetical protein [bacterium]
MRAHPRGLAFAAALAVLTGCFNTTTKPGFTWQAVQLWSIEELDTPESVLIDPATGYGFITSILPRGSAEGDEIYWERDNKAFITRLRPGGHLHQHRWATSAVHAPLGSPRGMALIDGVLYVADCDRVARYVVRTGQPISAVPIPGAIKLNDAATDGQHLYVSDTATGKIHKMRGNSSTEVKAMPGINGITFAEGKMYGVSVTLHEVYELDAAGGREPVPFGLASHFKGLNGIEVLDDGSFLVSDIQLHALFWISPDRTQVHPLLTIETPADFCLDRRRNLLFVPSFLGNRVVVYALRHGRTAGSFELRTVAPPNVAGPSPD